MVLGGIVAERMAQGNPYVLAPIPASLVIAAAVVGLKGLGKTLQSVVAEGSVWVAELGAVYGLGISVQVLTVVGPGYWGSWMLVSVFFALSVLMISLGEFVKKVAAESTEKSRGIGESPIQTPAIQLSIEVKPYMIVFSTTNQSVPVKNPSIVKEIIDALKRGLGIQPGSHEATLVLE